MQNYKSLSYWKRDQKVMKENNTLSMPPFGIWMILKISNSALLMKLNTQVKARSAIHLM